MSGLTLSVRCAKRWRSFQHAQHRENIAPLVPLCLISGDSTQQENLTERFSENRHNAPERRADQMAAL